jgi:hypothetical protein
MRLRQAHVDALGRAARETFVDRMVEHVASDLPRDYEQRGELGVRALVEQALDAADDVAIVTELGVCRYVELWIRYGVMCDRASAACLLVLDDGSRGELDRLYAIEALIRGGPVGQT